MEHLELTTSSHKYRRHWYSQMQRENIATLCAAVYHLLLRQNPKAFQQHFSISSSSTPIISSCPCPLTTRETSAKSIPLTVNFVLQLVPWLNPFAPASFILKRRRAPRRDRRAGFPIKLRIKSSATLSASVSPMICSTPTKMTLKTVKEVIRRFGESLTLRSKWPGLGWGL